MPNDTLFLGIDGGGTTCRARVCDLDGTIIGEGRGGPTNTNLGIALSYGEIIKATRQALATAGLGDEAMGRMHAGFGIAGLIYDRDKEAMRAFDHPFRTITLENDAHTACLGAHGGADGAIAIFGTGSCGYALVKGRSISIGGWGFRISDHGSGAKAGQEAVRRALQAHEDILPASDFTRAIMAKFDGSPERLGIWAETARPVDYGEFVPLLLEFADDNDVLANRIMRESSEEAAQLLRALHRKGADAISLIGGFSARLVDWLPEDVTSLLVTPKGDPMDGAIQMARSAQQL